MVFPFTEMDEYILSRDPPLKLIKLCELEEKP